MKKILAILLVVFLVLGLCACGSKESAPETETKSEEVKADPSKDEQEVKEEVEEEKTETSSESTEKKENTEAEEDDFQKGIPEEYRLKRNVDKEQYEPLPETEDNKGSGFLKLFGSLGNPGKTP